MTHSEDTNPHDPDKEVNLVTAREKSDVVAIPRDEGAPDVSNVEDCYPTAWRLSIIIAALCLGFLLVAIDTTIIAVAIPAISTEFKSLDDVGWYGSAYFLTVTALQPSFVGSILCAASSSSPIFILGRAIAGTGAAGLFQGALVIVGLSVPLVKRPLYLGIVVSVFGPATCFGPILGGAFTDHVSWRWCFWINVPIGGVVFFVITLFLRLKSTGNTDRSSSIKEKLQHMDISGAVSLIAAVCCLLLALQWGGTTYTWKSSRIIGLFMGFGLLALTFGVIQWKLQEKATVPPRVLVQRSVLMGAFFLFFINMTSYTIFYYIPFYFQAVQDVSALTSGIRLIPLVVPQLIMVVIVGALVTKTGHYVPFMIVGQSVAIVGTGLLTRIQQGTPTLQWAAYLVVYGLGVGADMQVPYTALQVVLSEEDAPIGNAIALFFSQLGGAIAVSLGQTIFLNGLLKQVPRHTSSVSAEAVYKAGPTALNTLTKNPLILRSLRDAYAEAIKDTLYIAVATSCLALLFAFCMEWKNVKAISEQRKEQGASIG